MSIVGAFDVHRRQLTFDYLDTVTGEVKRGRITPADREHLRAWLARFAGQDDVHLLVDWTIRSVKTGREASMTMHHYWRLRDGKVTYFRGSEDTQLTAEVFAA